MAEIEERELKNEMIEGRNAVIEALRAGRAIDKIFLAKGDVRGENAQPLFKYLTAQKKFEGFVILLTQSIYALFSLLFSIDN